MVFAACELGAPPWRIDLRWLGGAVGAVRDCDVLAGLLRAGVDALAPEDTASATQLLGHLATERNCARDQVLGALRSARYDALLESLVAGAGHVPFARRRDGDRFAARTVVARTRRRWRQLRRAVGDLAAVPTDADLHQVRILAKECRYAAEAAAPVVGPPARRFADAIATVQTVLGDHQDTVIVEAWLRDVVAADPTCGLVAGQLIARQQARRAELRGPGRPRGRRSRLRRSVAGCARDPSPRPLQHERSLRSGSPSRPVCGRDGAATSGGRASSGAHLGVRTTRAIPGSLDPRTIRGATCGRG